MALLAAGSLPAGAGQATTPRGTAVFPDGTRVSLEVVATEESRARGLMFRQQLGPREGMIFVFPVPGHYPFWMKNTLIPLDMIWLDPSRHVVAMAQSVPPCTADPCPSYAPVADGKPVGNALYVIEVQAGFVRRHGVAVGDAIRLSGVPGKGSPR